MGVFLLVSHWIVKLGVLAFRVRLSAQQCFRSTPEARIRCVL